MHNNADINDSRVVLGFATWIACQSGRDDAVGDFARDWAMAVDKPTGQITITKILAHLDKYEATPAAITAALQAVKECNTKATVNKNSTPSASVTNL